MKIQLTENAFHHLEMHPEFILPLNANECFKGGFGAISISSKNAIIAPDLTEDIHDIGNIIGTLKNNLHKEIRKLIPKDVSILPSKFLYQFIINNIHITLITRNDENSTNIPVRNLFKYKVTRSSEDSYESILVPNGPNDEDLKNKNLLGLYKPDNGTIFIWIDKIIEKESPELIFQTVLLHEMIHAFLDIHPRVYYNHKYGIRILSPIGKETQSDREEELDNTLVLQAYSTHPEQFYFIKEFISNQSGPYKKAINAFNNEDYITSLSDHLADKISNDKLLYQKNLYFDVEYTDADEDDYKPIPQPVFTKEIFRKYIEFLSDQFICSLGKIIFSFEEPIGKCYYYRFLMKSDWLKVNFNSQWLVFMFNESTKEMLLQFGDMFYIRCDYNEIKNCYKKMPDGTIKELSVYSDPPYFLLDFVPADRAESLFKSLVEDIFEGCILPSQFGIGLE